MGKTHSKGVEQGEFCAVRTSSQAKCKCASPNNYVKNSKITGDFFLQGSRKRVEKKFEAHHLLCIASATKFLGKNEVIAEIVKKTRWCINAENNMLGMPVWGHTIQHYCDIGIGSIIQEPTPPWFCNVPQHDYDHNSTGGYKSEVDKAMEKLAEQVKKLAKSEHEEPEKNLAGALEKTSDKFRALMATGRGLRTGGTHKAWLKGCDSPNSDWYLPFSMADDGVADKRPFPAAGMNSDGKVAKKIAKLAKALKKWGSS
jgi:hypothetical protein